VEHVDVGQWVVEQIALEEDEVPVQRGLDHLGVGGWRGVVLKVCVQADELDVVILLQLVEDDWFGHSVGSSKSAVIARIACPSVALNVASMS
jgi:hypothetical protein